MGILLRFNNRPQTTTNICIHNKYPDHDYRETTTVIMLYN